MAKKASKAKKVPPPGGGKDMSSKDKKKGAPPKREKPQGDVVDPFPGDPFELPKGKSGRASGLTPSTLST